MYEKQIEGLESIRRIIGTSERDKAALDAAIALMRAAEPKNEAAELRHCMNVCTDTATWEDYSVTTLMRERAAARAEVEAKYAAMLAPKDEAAEREHCERAAHEGWNGPLTLMVVIERERAAARAPLQTEIEQLKIEVLKQEGRAEGARDHRIELQAQIATAQAEIERLRTELRIAEEDADTEESRADHNHDLCMEACDQRDELREQLATLRAAAERAVVELQDKHLSLAAFDALRAALDATSTTVEPESRKARLKREFAEAKERVRAAGNPIRYISDATSTTVDPRVTRLIEASERYLSTPHTGDRHDADAHDALRAALEAFK
jgi:chromosome segregation ATPase